MFETFKNKHVVVALIVAPILAILSWYATGFIVDEKEHAMKDGAIYTLVVRPNCRWANTCTRTCTQCSFKFIYFSQLVLCIHQEFNPAPGTQNLSGELLLCGRVIPRACKRLRLFNNLA